MGIPIEAAGDLVTEAVILNELDKRQRDEKTSMHDTHGGCANCGTQLAGAYCHQCGQSSHIHRSLWHMIEELLHGIFHFETKSWRTIPALIFKPGQLTRRYIDGQRTRFVSPLALFLFLIFLMFFVLSYTSSGKTDGDFSEAQKLGTQTKETITKELASTDQKIKALEEKIKKTTDAEAIADLQVDLSELQTEKNDLEKLVKVAVTAEDAIREKASIPASSKTSTSARQSPSEKNETKLKEENYEWSDDILKRDFHTNVPEFDATIKHALRNPELALYKFKSAFSKFAFLLMPISLPFLWLLFVFRRDVVIFDHAVFSLYSLSFMCLLSMTVALLHKAGMGNAVLWLVFLAPPLHMFAQLRGTYKLSKRSALWRTAALLFIAGISMSIYVVIAVALAVK
ncbi:MAG: DUF3667 domain-containing protein [Burkholderiaceae bacterium]|nr:DUF3667 domain-containing protein [Burkholderiaceae bacterium]